MKCLETRRRDGMKWRRYRAEDGRIVTTFELPTSVLLHLTSRARIKAAIEAFERAQKAEALRIRVRALSAEGWKTIAIAHEVGLSVGGVHRIIRRGKKS